MSNFRLNQKIFKEIQKAQKILLTLHPSPDGDSIGANLAMYHALTKMGKQVTLLGGDSVFPQNFKSLPGTNKIVPKNFFQINQSDYDLFIIIDIAAPGMISRQGNMEISKRLKTIIIKSIIIDHHASNPKFADINWVNPKAHAASQLVYEFFKKNKIKITKNIAICLFVGIYTDTGGFKYFHPTYRTFLIAAELAKINPSFDQAIFEIENNENPSRLKFVSLMLDSIKTYLSDSVAVASINYQSLQKNNINNSVINTSEISNILKAVTGWEIGVCMVELQPNLVKISFRTRDANKYNLSKLSTAVGGGGHKAAAGAVLNMSLSDATKLVIKTIKRVFPKI